MSVDIAARRGRAWMGLAILWLIGAGLRTPLLSVPPLLPAIHRDLRLDEAAIGMLTGLPMLVLMAATVLGSLFVARLGARNAMIVGSVMLVLAGSARAAGGSPWTLFTMTVLLGAGIAICQPALPSLALSWFPNRVGFATAIYTNGMLIGETLPAALTAPLLLQGAGMSWGWALVLWSCPAGIGGILLARYAPGQRFTATRETTLWWPDWRDATPWKLGLILGCASVTYFSANTFIPEFLRAAHRPELIAGTLTSLNLMQLPASLLVTVLPGRVIGKRWPVAAAAVFIALATIAFIALDPRWSIVSAGAIGFAAGLVFILSLAMPAFLAGHGDVHRLTAAMLTITYACGFAGPLIGGMLWDVTSLPAAGFAPVLVAAAAMLVLARYVPAI